MRTPWRFVADLVSRTPKVDSREKHQAPARELIALEHQPTITEATDEIDVKSAEQTVKGATARSNSETSPEPAQISDDLSAATAEDSSLTSADAKNTAIADASSEIKESVAAKKETPTADFLTKPVQTPKLKRQETTRPVVTQPAHLSQVEENTSTVPTSLIDEMADLDAEVGALRRQLAEKLSEQNAQLRKMLARFDAR